MIRPHCDKVGTRVAAVASGATGGTRKPGPVPPAQAVMALLSIVTVPLRARARPCRLALVPMVMLVNARMLPWNEVNVPSAAELPTCHQMSHGVAPLMRFTMAAPGPEAVVSEVVWNT